jgi:hypothetical protein
MDGEFGHSGRAVGIHAGTKEVVAPAYHHSDVTGWCPYHLRAGIGIGPVYLYHFLRRVMTAKALRRSGSHPARLSLHQQYQNGSQRGPGHAGDKILPFQLSEGEYSLNQLDAACEHRGHQECAPWTRSAIGMVE